MIFPSLVLLLILSLLHTTSSNVYYVIPDDHHTTNNNTYTLQHYLNNTNKYFTSHTQLYLLPGQYYLKTDLIIQRVSNLSLIGNRTNEVINSVIKCTSTAGIVVVGSSNIVIANIVMKECGNDYNYLTKKYSIKKSLLTTLLTMDSVSISIEHFYSKSYKNFSEINLFNVWGNIMLSKLTSFNIDIWYSGKYSKLAANIRNINISFFEPYNISHSVYAITIKHYHTKHHLSVKLANINFINRPALFMHCYRCSNYSTLTVENCSFRGRNSTSLLSTVKIKNVYCTGHVINPNTAFFIACNFTSNTFLGILLEINIYWDPNNYYSSWTLYAMYMSINITKCNFQSNECNNIYQINSGLMIGCKQNNILTKLYLNDVVFTNTKAPSLIQGQCISVYSTGLIIFNATNDAIIISTVASKITIHKYFEISKSQAISAIKTRKILLKESVILNFTDNNFVSVFATRFVGEILLDAKPVFTSDECVIQYNSKKGNLDSEFEMGKSLNYSIIFYKNKIVQFNDDKMTHCTWEKGTAFLTSIPLHIMRRFVHFIDNNITTPSYMAATRTLCLCANNKIICNKEELGPYFAGQTVTLNFTFVHKFLHTLFNPEFTVMQIIESNSSFVCKCGTFFTQINSNECKMVKFKVRHSNFKWCELSLLLETWIHSNQLKQYIERYTIRIKHCPLGFSLHPQGYCQCDPILSSHIPSLTTCDIDHQTIPRPANTWISAHTINNSHSYHVSLHCPFDYCLPHSSQLNLSISDSQCQFNRSGVLCGQCQHGFSTVFGTEPKCEQCSNVYLILILPIAVSGVLLILCMFAFNVTINKGIINGYLLYVNILGINQSVLISSSFSIEHFLISLSNLNLGMSVCFYNGMDDYIKMWLQLVFPIYLIFIATLLIITSRYSTTIQRLTARRALPVLATLFLLSYTKVLLTVSNVLFSYTSITYLPSNHTTLVWSVDTSVPLFGVKFTILFSISVVIFLSLIMFTVILTFTKITHLFKCCRHFNSLLDCYKAPFKKHFHFWVGLQLAVRVLFWGVSYLKINDLMTGLILISLIICLQEKLSPYCNKIYNINEIFYMLNLFSIYVVVSVSKEYSIITSILTLFAILQLMCTILLQNFSIKYGFKMIYKVITSKVVTRHLAV